MQSDAVIALTRRRKQLVRPGDGGMEGEVEGGGGCVGERDT